MFNPPHPGLSLRDDVLPALGVGINEAARQLGVSRVTLSRMLNGHAAISPDMALRLELWLGVERGGDASVWLAEQAAYDLWHGEQGMKNKPQPFSGFAEFIGCADSQVLTEAGPDAIAVASTVEVDAHWSLAAFDVIEDVRASSRKTYEAGKSVRANGTARPAAAELVEGK